ncbi:MAG: pyridoxamine 5'-phosphate oxidase family protein [Candidatus Spyradosoma sp.]
MTAEEKFRPRRADRALPPEEAERVLREAEYGTISMVDPDGNEPYGVPVSFVFFDGAIWIHSALEGRKFRVFADAPRVHFSAAQNVRAAFTRHFTSFYESVMAAGQIVPVNDDAEKRAALRELCRKYLPERMDVADEHVERALARTAVFKILPDRLSAKANAAK